MEILASFRSGLSRALNPRPDSPLQANKMKTINQSSTIPHRIDVHHHIVPAKYVAALKGIGIEAAHGAGFPKWSPAMALDVMDRNGIAAAITSISSPGVYFGDANFARDLARRCNEFSAQLVSNNPDRFGFFAVLPLPDTEAALKEAEYALDTLNADGVVLLASTGGKFLGDSDFEELMFELNRRQAIIFIHPNIHPSSEKLKLDMPGFLIEFLFDTTRAVINLIYTGTLERYPALRWILSHAGGTVPYIAWRLSLANFEPEFLARAPRGMLAYLKSFYYDTALSSSPYAMKALLELVGPSQILFGSDFPFAPEPIVAKEVEDLQKLDLFKDQTLKAIERDNALTLFPKFKWQRENISDAQYVGIQAQKKISIRTRIALSLARKVMNV